MDSFRRLALVAALVAAGFVSACGGGGGGGADGAADTPAATQPDPALTQGSQTYRLASQFGTVLTLTMDTGAGTFSYASTGVAMSGTLSATGNGTYLLNTGLSGGNVQAEVQLKDGALGGVLVLQDPVSGSLATAIVAGANDKLVQKDTSKIAARYIGGGVSTAACNFDAAACGDFVGAPTRFTRTTSSQLTVANCAPQAGMGPQAILALDPAACPTNNGASTLNQRAWTMAADGTATSSVTVAPSLFQVFFADFGGAVVGFTAGGRPRAGTTPGSGSAAVLFPAEQATQASALIGTWNFAAKTDRLTFDVKSLTDVSVHVTGEAATTTETLDGFTLNQWGIGGNTMATNDAPPTLLPVFVAGPWAAFHVVDDGATHIGLKR